MYLFHKKIFTTKSAWKFTHLIAIIFLFSSIYSLQYTREYSLRQKKCHEKSVESRVWITRPPVVSGSGYQVETVDSIYLFSREHHLDVGNEYQLISTSKEFSQCVHSHKKVLIVQDIHLIHENDASYYSLGVKMLADGVFLIQKYLQQSEHEIRANLPVQHADIALGMVLGRKVPNQSQTSVMMSTAGVSHILVASGANLVLLLSFLHALMRRLFSRKIVENLSVILIVLYVLIVGFQAPIIRASLFFLTLLLGKRQGRQVHAMYALFLTAMIMLIFQPFLIYSLSYWLSLSASFALLFQQSTLRYGREESKNQIASYGRETASSTILVFCFTAPLLIFTFGTVSLQSMISNLLLLWLVGPISIVGVLVVVLIPLIPSVIQPVLLVPFWFLEEIFVRLINLILRFPQLEIPVTKPELWGIIFFYLSSLLYYFYRLANKRDEC